MADRIDSYCGTTYVDTKEESMDGHYPVGPHPYETCLAEQHRRLQLALISVGTYIGAIQAIEKRIHSRDLEVNNG